MAPSTSSREGSCDRSDRSDSLVLKHQHSFSESGRASVPMWDSSDPDRAPPPLPLNPGTSSSPVTRPHTSARIEEAAALITARARDSAPSSYTSTALPSGSPERKPQHKRMQSIQGNTVGRLSDSLERRSPDKGLRAPKLSEYDEYRASRSPERSPTRSGSETPTPSGRVTPSHLHRPILGENTPPSATMLALQTMRQRQDAEAPLSNITNGMPSGIPSGIPSGVSSTSRTSPTYDAISSQILSLTSIATNLQREMAQLSRRSKDNATDLISLKEATNARDEDIRKSLKDLVNGLDHRFTSLDTKLLPTPEAARSTPNLGLYLENKAHSDSPVRRNVVLPRIPSPTSFAAALDRDVTASPSFRSSEGAASIALLEKVLREMATRDGQERIIQTLESVKQRPDPRAPFPAPSQERTVDPEMLRKLDEVLTLLKDVRDSSGSRALVKAGGGGGGDHGREPSQVDRYIDQEPQSGPLTRSHPRLSTGPGQASDFVNDEIMKLLKSVKQSLAQGGGLTNEVKALVRELRGEVLGMGREIARKLEQVEFTQQQSAGDEARGPGREEIAAIVHAGLAELTEQMHHIVREKRRQSAGSTRSVVDTQEVVHAVRSALADMPQMRSAPVPDAAQEREELLASIKEAWEDCKPEIALEHFGLERDEILDTLKEGLKSYQPQSASPDAGVTYAGVIEAVQQALADFKPPAIPTEASLTREEILVTVRECLESFEFPMPTPAPSQVRELDLTREDVLDAVKQGFLAGPPPVAKEVDFNRSDLFAAVKASLQGDDNPLGVMGERVLGAMHDFLGSMKTEFQQYSAANGKDTEQVLDAMKDGLEELRADIETYVDRAADVTGKDEIIDTVKAGFAAMQADLDKGFASPAGKRSSVDTPDMLDAMEKEFEHLRESITKTLARGAASSNHEEILDAIRDLAEDRQSSLSSNSDDVVRLVKEELEHMRTALAGTLVRGGGSVQRDDVLDAIREGLESSRSVRKPDGSESMLSNTSELLDAFQEGVDGIRSDMQKLMDRPVDLSTSYEILDTLKAGLDGVRADIERLHEKQNDFADNVTTRGREVIVHDENLISTEIEGLKVMITQLRIKVEALDELAIPPPAMPTEVRMHKDDLAAVHAAIKEVHHSVSQVRSAQEVPLSHNAASKDDTDAIETLLRNVKARVDDLSVRNLDGTATTAQLDAIEALVKDMAATVEDTAVRADEQSLSKDDVALLELMFKEVSSKVDELHANVAGLSKDEDRVTKADIQAVETLCFDTKTQMEELAMPDPTTLPTKDDVARIHDAIKAVQEQMESDNELTAQAFEARKTEHGGLATKLDDVNGVLADLRDELLEKLDGGAEGMAEMQKVLGAHHETMNACATAKSVAEVSDRISTELARHLEHHEKSKVENDDRAATLFHKHDESSAEVKAKIEEKFGELMVKYDDAQSANAAKLQAIEARDGQTLDALTGTKTVVDDLRLLIDTLGSTVTETCDRMSDDTKTLYTGVEAANTKLGNLHSSNAHEHGLTRDEVARTLAAAMRLEGSINEHQPAMLAAVREVLGVVSLHYEHAQQHTEHFAAATEELKTGLNAIPSSIQPLLPAPASPPPPVREMPVPKEYDDSQVHDKLNNLIAHTAIAKEAFASLDAHHRDHQESLSQMERLDQLDKLDKIDDIHHQVMATADELSAMVATQSRLMSEHHESRAAEATEAAIALEKRTAQKEQVEGDIIALSHEKEALVQSMAALRREHDELSQQTKRLTREVAKLETALTIRQEEMKDMNERAATLERRILEGVMNHARSVNLSKPATRSKATPAQRDASMNLRRVPSSASTVTTKTSVKDGNSAIGSALGMALKRRSPAPSTISSRASGVERRILSTSNVTGNRSRDVPERALMLAPTSHTGLVSLKRSHSVKSNPSSYLGGRKATWNGNRDAPTIEDKENQVLNQHHDEDHDSDSNPDGSEPDTEKRSSLGGTSYMYTDSLAYGTGSSVSTHGARTASYASSIGGAVGGKTESIAEEEEEEQEEEHDDAPTPSPDHAVHQERQSAQIMALLDTPSDAVHTGHDASTAMTSFDGLETPGFGLDGMSDLQPPRLITDGAMKYNGGSDSGLGSEPPTATIDEHHGAAQEYFAMSQADMH